LLFLNQLCFDPQNLGFLFSLTTKRANPTFAQSGITPTCDAELLWSWYVVGGGEQMTNEETIQMEDAKMVAEQEAWERLHKVIFKELFHKTEPVKLDSSGF
jgi:hypothetical protein